MHRRDLDSSSTFLFTRAPASWQARREALMTMTLMTKKLEARVEEDLGSAAGARRSRPGCPASLCAPRTSPGPPSESHARPPYERPTRTHHERRRCNCRHLPIRLSEPAWVAASPYACCDQPSTGTCRVLQSFHVRSSRVFQGIQSSLCTRNHAIHQVFFVWSATQDRSRHAGNITGQGHSKHHRPGYLDIGEDRWVHASSLNSGSRWNASGPSKPIRRMKAMKPSGGDSP
eukprot:scaffold388_cov380-Prasinococcus_capsulatus_cf.AAC.23